MPFDLGRIGQMLKATREENGLTLDEISKALIIKKRVISAIESGDWDSLPPPVYVKGYVTQYAALLNIVDLLEAEIVRAESQPPAETQSVVTKERASKRWTPKKKVMVAVAVGVVALGFIVFQNLPKTTTVAPPASTVESTREAVQTAPAAPPAQTVESTRETAQTAPGTQAAPATQAVEPKTQAAPVAPPATKEQQAEASPVAAEHGVKPVLEQKKLTIVCQDRTWVRIIIDGLEQKEFTLKPEEVIVLEAKENFDLLIGNAGGVKLFYNGKETAFSGQTGEVKHVRLP